MKFRSKRYDRPCHITQGDLTQLQCSCGGARSRAQCRLYCWKLDDETNTNVPLTLAYAGKGAELPARLGSSGTINNDVRHQVQAGNIALYHSSPCCIPKPPLRPRPPPPPVLRLERDAWPIAKLVRQATDEYALPLSTRPPPLQPVLGGRQTCTEQTPKVDPTTPTIAIALSTRCLLRCR